jgi:hypothetical protein
MKLSLRKITNRYERPLRIGFACKLDLPMKLERLAYKPAALVDFYEETFGALGALCERTWHDRLQIVAEGRPAKLWNPEGSLHEIELTFAPADAATARDASREVFPGCPLTFSLAESLRPRPLGLERALLAVESTARAPDPSVAEKLWRAQFPDTTRWRLLEQWKADFHFSLVALARCEIQAIDQHWSLHRIAVALPGGETDPGLAQHLSFAQLNAQGASAISWPAPDLSQWQNFLRSALESELSDELTGIRARQENYLRRELERIDQYFHNYEREMATRNSRANKTAQIKSERLAAAKAEHTRRRADQIARHEIRVHPHLDALMLFAEPAWRTTLKLERARIEQQVDALFAPRARRWFACNKTFAF